MQKSVNKKPITNQLQFCFNEEKITNNFRRDNSPLLEGMISLLNVEYKIADVASAFHSRQGIVDKNKQLIGSHCWLELSYLLDKLKLINEFLYRFIQNPDQDLFEFFMDFDEEKQKIEEPLI